MHTLDSIHRGAPIRALFALFLTVALPAQDARTRTELIEKERDAKAAKLQPDEVSPAEKRLRAFKDSKYLERLAAGYNGLRVKIGNMVTGGGFALGPEYFREDLLRGQLTARASAQFSTRGYQKYEAQALLPRLANGKISLEGIASHRNYASLQYYGTGPESAKINRTNYRLEDTSIDGILAVEPARGLKFGASLGYLWTNVGPGNDNRFASTEKIFRVPGIDRQTNFLRNGLFAQYDYRDHPLGMAKSGGNYIVQYSWFRDEKLDRFGFRRLDVELQQFIPFLNKTRVIALRAKATLTETEPGEQVPFYLQPILGGSDDLRGYRFFRFSDRNSMVMNAEYRWEIFSGLDGAIFADAGKVFPRRGMLNFRDLESSAGFGLRFNARNATFMRLDVGFSQEGVQLWIKFNDVFLSRRFGTTTGQPVY
ncbi:MAG: BamA/TamA family outer membrane protein [Bryobacteraceae bacterium]